MTCQHQWSAALPTDQATLACTALAELSVQKNVGDLAQVQGGLCVSGTQEHDVLGLQVFVHKSSTVAVRDGLQAANLPPLHHQRGY
eukprot:6377295-Amphidinium_carterae.1